MTALNSIVLLTGAGISAESGIQTFRASDGLWANHAIEEVATPDAYARNPAKVLDFYNQRRTQLQDPQVAPNAAHLALAKFEQALTAQGGRFTLITQNVDNLHRRAGSQNLIAMHGELQSVFCPACGHRQTWVHDLNSTDLCPVCAESAPLRPDIVWFGEIPYQLDACQAAVEQADLFVSIGTSGQVYPAAGFVALAKSAGALTAELNLEPTRKDFDFCLYGPATQVVPAFFEQLMNQPTQLPSFCQ